jgi:hypothetical protein
MVTPHRVEESTGPLSVGIGASQGAARPARNPGTCRMKSPCRGGPGSRSSQTRTREASGRGGGINPPPSAFTRRLLTSPCHPSGRAEGRRFAPGGVEGAGRLKQPMERTPTGTYRTQEVGTAHPTALVKLAFCQNTKQLISQFKSPRVAHTSPVPCRLATTPSPHSADRSRVAIVC